MVAPSNKELTGLIGLFQSLYDSVKEDVGFELVRWKNRREVQKLYRHLKSIQKVKTIWDPDKAIDLAKFYCPSHAILPKDGRQIVRSIDDLSSENNVVVRGIAGQGKSILLRYLCSVELKRCQRVPVFIELRKLSAEKPISNHIEESFVQYGLEYNEEAFDALYQEGKICLLLDGFDELHESIISDVVYDIETLSARFPNLNIVVTSRPESAICSSASFDVVQLDNLNGEEYKQVIDKLLGRSRLKPELIKAINDHGRDVKDLLTTPLLVTLLTITYRTFERIPETLSEFYDSIFEALLLRHDKLKPGYKRTRSAKLSDTDFRRVFEAFCFYLNREKGASFTRSAVVNAAQRGIETSNVNSDPDKFVGDLIGITCLLIRDATEHRFIHRSIHEYFSACHIQRRPRQFAKRFYENISAPNAVHAFRGICFFLKEIDNYRYTEFFVIPSYKEMFDLSTDSEIETLTKVQRIKTLTGKINSYTVYFRLQIFDELNRGAGSVGVNDTPTHGHYKYLYHRELSLEYARAFQSDACIQYLKEHGKKEQDDYYALTMPLPKMIELIGKESALKNCIETIEAMSHEETLGLYQDLRKAESEDLSDLIPY